MGISVLFLLLPIAAFSGWWIARRQYSASKKETGFKYSTEYFEGLNYVLNEQPDKAIEIFIRMTEIDQDTVETHLALGNLFRRRGEVDRAIRIHQNLIARPSLTSAQRELALLELANDYMNAGLLDRAENLFLELSQSGEFGDAVYQNLVDIYQREKEWQKAIAVSEKQQGQDVLTNRKVAQYYCELAEEFRVKRDTRMALQMLKKALHKDRDCVRANLIKGDLYLETRDYRNAVRAYEAAIDQDSEYVPEVLPRMEICFREMDRPELFREVLEKMIRTYNGVSPVILLAGIIAEQEGHQEAMDFLVERLRKNPSIRGVQQFMHLAGETSKSNHELDQGVLSELIEGLLMDQPVYRCGHCGFSGKSMHWLCPGCKRWSTIKPIQGIQGE